MGARGEGLRFFYAQKLEERTDTTEVEFKTTEEQIKQSKITLRQVREIHVYLQSLK